MSGRVDSEHVVVDHHVVIAELLHGLGVGPHAGPVGTDLGLREDDSEAHGPMLVVSPWRQPPFGATASLFPTQWVEEYT